MIFKSQLKTILVLVLVLMVGGCAPPKVALIWKTEQAAPPVYNKILVAGIVREGNDSTRKEVENEVVTRMNAIGLRAVSSATTFGSAGLRDLGQEATYLALCDSGVDAVLTFALVEVDNGSALVKGPARKYTSGYYYDRIWNYHRLSRPGQTGTGTTAFVWEAILFDLNSLEPRGVLQARPFHPVEGSSGIAQLAEQVINKMMKERIIRKQRRPEQLKAF